MTDAPGSPPAAACESAAVAPDATRSAPAHNAVDQLERLLKVAALLAGCSYATLVLIQKGVGRVVACHGQPVSIRSYEWNFAETPYAPDEIYHIRDIEQEPALRAMLAAANIGDARSMTRLPLRADDRLVLTLLITDPAPRDPPSDSVRALLAELGALIRDEFAAVEHLLIDPQCMVTVAMPLEAVYARAVASPHPVVVFDENFIVRFANDAAVAASGQRREELVGARYKDRLNLNLATLRLLFATALERKISSPLIELSTRDADGRSRTFRMLASPFSPTGLSEYLLYVELFEATHLTVRADDLEQRADRALQGARPVPEPTAQFLDETLVRRRSLRTRHGVTYLTLRSWRAAIREYQIKAIAALKLSPPAAFVDQVAAEIETEVNCLIGMSAFKAIVPMACGRSAQDACLSTALARRLGERCGLPVLNVLELPAQTGRSHPKSNVRRGPMRLRHTIADPVLLIDDVATSGAHIEEAVGLLRQESPVVMPVAWISGDAAG